MTNLRIYLTAICLIKKPIYLFNETNGEIYIKDPARSRVHLQILAENVVKYFDTIIAGLTKMDGNEIIKDIPNEQRRERMESLRQKSVMIIDILTN
jgi:hypothetical protein